MITMYNIFTQSTPYISTPYIPYPHPSIHIFTCVNVSSKVVTCNNRTRVSSSCEDDSIHIHPNPPLSIPCPHPSIHIFTCVNVSSKVVTCNNRTRVSSSCEDDSIHIHPNQSIPIHPYLSPTTIHPSIYLPV